MSSQFLLSVAAIATGGGFVQLLIFLLKRRSEIRALDRGSDAGLLTSANELISRQQADSDALRKEITRLSGAHRDLEAAIAAERVHFTRQMDIAHAENARLGGQVAQLRTDLDIANRQIGELRRMGGRP